MTGPEGLYKNLAVRPQPHRHAFRCMSCNSTVVVRHIGKSMVLCHAIGTLTAWSGTLHASCNSAVVVRHIGKSMVPCHRHPHRCMSSNSAVVVRHIGKSMVPCIGLHSVACSTTWPDRRGQAHRKVDGSMPSASTSLHVLQLGPSWSGTGKSMVRHIVCSATRPDRRGQAHSMVPRHRHPHRCLSCTKGV